MTTTTTNDETVVSEQELNEMYYRACVNSSDRPHAFPWTYSRFDAEYVKYVQRGRSIPDGKGKYRDNSNPRNGKYGAYRYPVVEIGWV